MPPLISPLRPTTNGLYQKNGENERMADYRLYFMSRKTGSRGGRVRRGGKGCAVPMGSI